MFLVPTIEDIREAAARIKSHCLVTELLESESLNRRVGARVLVKAESEQRTGSFKFRGAVNRIAQLTQHELAMGVVAFSSGNHGIAVSAAAQAFGTRAVILMPENCPQVKKDLCESYGAELIFYNRATDDREELTARVASARGLTLVPPYEDAMVIAGAATVALEVFQQTKVALDSILTPCSGGGLTAGTALACAYLSSETSVIAIEPVGHDDTGRSLRLGSRVSNEPCEFAFCDSLLAMTPGENTFAINRRLDTQAATVTDDEVREAMNVAMQEFGLIVEPGGAAGLAAVLAGRVVQGTTCVILSGRNAAR